MDSEKTDLLTMTDVEHNLPSDVAACVGHEYVCQKFLEYAEKNKELLKRIQSSIILAASEAGHLAIVKLLFPDKDKPPLMPPKPKPPNLLQLVDEQGRTCLHKAAEKGN